MTTPARWQTSNCRCKQRRPVALSLVPSPTRSAAPRSSLLQEFLDTELEPGLTIEQACFPSVVLFEQREQPRPHELANGRILLNGAGLQYLEADAFEPGHVILRDQARFLARFPHLAAVVPLLLQAKGVMVCSGVTAVAPALSLVTPGKAG